MMDRKVLYPFALANFKDIRDDGLFYVAKTI